MTATTTFIVLAIMGWFGTAIAEPICSENDRRYTSGMVISTECNEVNEKLEEVLSENLHQTDDR